MPAVFHVVVGPDRGHAYVPALPLSMVAGSVKAMMCTLTSVTATRAQVSDNLLLLVRFYKCSVLTNISSMSVYLAVKMYFLI